MEPDAAPEPLTPPDCDVRGIEPPWELFRQMLVDDMGATEAQASEAMANAKRIDEERRRAGWYD